MKTRKFLTMLLAMLLIFAMVGTFAGCGEKDSGNDKRVEKDDSDKKNSKDDDEDEDEDEDKDEDKDKDKNKDKDKEEDPEATATPEPTATPEVLPTPEELIVATQNLFDENMKLTMKFAYKGEGEDGEAAMSIDSVQYIYDNITYQKSSIAFAMMGINQTMDTETYYVDDEASSMRTEYSWNSDTDTWYKSEYLYAEIEQDEEEDNSSFSLDNMNNIEITHDDNFYYLSCELSNANLLDSDTISIGMDGLKTASTTCVLTFDKATKKALAAEIVTKYDVSETDEGTFTVDDFVMTVELCTEPIVIPEEALNAVPEPEVDLDWDFDDELNLPEPEKYTKDEMPESWDGWYDEYNCKSGTFLMTDYATYDDIPITVFAKDNWYFDNEYTYTLYLVVDDPAISVDEPAHEAYYSDSDVLLTTPDRVARELVEKDYNEVTTEEDMVQLEYNGKPCYYIDTTDYDYARSFLIFQDIGLDTYVEISVMTSDFSTEASKIVQMFLLDISEN